MPAEYQALPRHDGAGRLATPGLIDCHTHLVYGGERANAEFAMRLAGPATRKCWGRRRHRLQRQGHARSVGGRAGGAGAAASRVAVAGQRRDDP